MTVRRRLVLTVYAGSLALAILLTALSFAISTGPRWNGKWMVIGRQGAVTQYLPEYGRQP